MKGPLPLLFFVAIIAMPQTSQQPGSSSQTTTKDCSTPQSPTPSRAKQTLSWAQRQAAKLAALRDGQGISGGTNTSQTGTQPVASTCPSPANETSGGQPVGTSFASARTVSAGRTVFSGTANNNQFGRGQAGMGRASGGYVEWDHNGRAANSEIPNVFVKEPGKAPAEAAYLGHEETVPNVHYLRSTAESVTYKMVFNGNNFVLSRLSTEDEIAVTNLTLVGGSQQSDDAGSTDTAQGVVATSPIEISNGDGTQAVLTYTSPRGRAGTVNVHRTKASPNPNGEWLNPDETVIFTVAGTTVTLSPAKSQ